MPRSCRSRLQRLHLSPEALPQNAPSGWRTQPSFDGLATNNLPHGGITSETVGVVHVFISTKATKHRLTELSRHTVPSVLTGRAVLENISGNLGEAKSIVKLAISE